MKYINLGRTGLKVSRLCLGTFNFYHVTPENEALSILNLAESCGINFFDTANIYGKEKSCRGAAESLIGEWLQKKKGRRNHIVLCTKVYGPMSDEINHCGLSAYHIRQACEDSLRRLKTDHIDVYQMHHFDPATPLEEIWQAFEILIAQGKVLYIGSSNFSAGQIYKTQFAAEKKGLFGLVSEQSIFNLIERSVEFEVLSAIKDIGMGFMPWSPLAGGLLAGAKKAGDPGRRSLPHKQQEFEQNSAALMEYENICTELNIKPSLVALAWLMQHECVTAPVIGARNTEQLQENLQSLEVNLTDDYMERLNRLWPGPGVAPDCYTKWGSPR